MAESPIEIDVDSENALLFDHKMRDLYHGTRPEYEECLLRYKVLKLMNSIWQQYLIEKEQNAMINKSNTKYASIITDESSIEIETIENAKTKPYQKYLDTAATTMLSDGSNPSDGQNKHKNAMSSNGNPNPIKQRNVWCTPIEAAQKVIVIREFEGGPILKEVVIPSIMIFGSIAVGLDGHGSDIDLALPAGIYCMFFIPSFG